MQFFSGILEAVPSRNGQKPEKPAFQSLTSIILYSKLQPAWTRGVAA